MLHFFLIVASLLLSSTLQNLPPIYNCTEAGGQIAISNSIGLQLLDTATGEVKTLVERGDSVIDEFSWSPDGTRLAFDTEQNSTWGIYIVEMSESGEALGGPQVLFDSPDADESHPLISPDGTWLAFTLNGRLHVANLDNGDVRDLSVETSHFLWSTDGSQLLYIMNEAGGWTLASVDVVIGGTTALASGRDVLIPYSISADGILLLELIPDSDSHLIAVDTLSGEITNFDTVGYVPQWSPDGRNIAFMMPFDIIIMEADGTNRQEFTENFSNDVRGSIQWSPDGMYIAFNAYGTDYEYSDHVHVLNVDTHEVTVFADAVLRYGAPQWRPCRLA